MQAVEAGNHEEGGAELGRAPGIAPGSHPVVDQLAPLKGLQADKTRSQHGGDCHQDHRPAAVAPIGIVHGHGHGAAAGDQDECHHGDQQQRQMNATHGEGENLADGRPGVSGRQPYIHVAGEEDAENEGVAEQEYPHHQLAPGHVEGLLVGAPVPDHAGNAGFRVSAADGFGWFHERCLRSHIGLPTR